MNARGNLTIHRLFVERKGPAAGAIYSYFHKINCSLLKPAQAVAYAMRRSMPPFSGRGLSYPPAQPPTLLRKGALAAVPKITNGVFQQLSRSPVKTGAGRSFGDGSDQPLHLCPNVEFGRNAEAVKSEAGRLNLKAHHRSMEDDFREQTAIGCYLAPHLGFNPNLMTAKRVVIVDIFVGSLFTHAAVLARADRHDHDLRPGDRHRSSQGIEYDKVLVLNLHASNQSSLGKSGQPTCLDWFHADCIPLQLFLNQECLVRGEILYENAEGTSGDAARIVFGETLDCQQRLFEVVLADRRPISLK
jgi:hypothetical protein